MLKSSASMAEPTPEKPRSLFLELPAEIRQIIYEFALAHEPRAVHLDITPAFRALKSKLTRIVPRASLTPARKQGRVMTVDAISLNALVLTCRQIYLEADSTFFYRNNRFVAYDIPNLAAFILDTRKLHLQAIRELTLEVVSCRVLRRDLKKFQSSTNLNILTLSHFQSEAGMPKLWNRYEPPSRFLMRELVKTTWGLHSLRTIQVITSCGGGSYRNLLCYYENKINPDDIPGWVYAVEDIDYNRVREFLQRMYSPHPKEMTLSAEDHLLTLHNDDVFE